MKIKIKEMCEITSSKRIFAGEYQNTGIPFYRGKEITLLQSGSKDISDLIYIANKKYDEIKLKYGVPVKGDILLTSVGTIGNPYYVPNDSKFYFKDGNLTWFRNFKNVESKYLYYWLLSPVGKYELGKSTIGSSQKAYTISLLNEMEIELPNLTIQQKIASILSTYDDLIETNEKRIKILEEIAQRLYTEWFVHFRFPGDEKVKLVNSHTSIGMIPEGWEVMPIGEVITAMGGGTPSRSNVEYWENGDINWYTPTDLTKSATMFSEQSSQKISMEGLQKSSAKIFPKYSVMMTSRATIGAITINTEESCTNQGFIICIPNEKLQVYYIYYWLKSRVPDFIDRASGATFKELSRGEFKKFKVLIPTQRIMEQFSQLISAYGDEILSLQKQMQRLTNLRDLLLPQLISGKKEIL